MECLNKLLKKVKSGVIIALMLMMCITTPSFATDPVIEEGPPESTEEETVGTDLPHMDMKVKVGSKVGGANQVLVECWASKINNLETIDIIFTYDKTILQPSYISGENQNDILAGIDTIKWETRRDAIDPSTKLSTDEEIDFMNRNTDLLSKSFEFKNGYGNDLEIFIFQYLATEGNNEAVQFVTEKTTDAEITTEEEVLLGTFSFRKIGDASLEETFSTRYIGITSDNNEEGFEIRDITGKYGDTNCEDLVVFVYEKYGSISGKISASIKSESGRELNKNFDKPIVTVKIYKKEDVKDIDWTITGNNYVNLRINSTGERIESKLPNSYKEFTTEAINCGEFSITEVEFGEYVLLIDKDYYADVIITNLVINSENKDIDLVERLKGLNIDIIKEGVVNLIPGDIDNDGKLTTIADPKLFKVDSQKKRDSEVDLDDSVSRNIKNAGTDATIFKKATQDYKRSKQTIKRVIEL